MYTISVSISVTQEQRQSLKCVLFLHLILLKYFWKQVVKHTAHTNSSERKGLSKYHGMYHYTVTLHTTS